MARCQHYEVCKREHEGIPENGLCILHSEDPDKDWEEFNTALGEHRRARGNDFRFIRFPEDASFTGTFEGWTSFADVIFRGKARFGDVTFEGETSFLEATFEGEAIFAGATFKEDASFAGATFEGKASFTKATFKKKAYFGESISEELTFKRDVYFLKATFEGETSFLEATFEGETYFDKCRILGRVTFAGLSEEQRTFASDAVNFRSLVQGPDSQLLFRYADLSRCRFLRTNLRRIDFDGVKWCEGVAEDEWFSRVGVYDEIHEKEQKAPEEPETQAEQGRRWYEIERLYRQLKKNYEERGDYPRAGDFHIGEKQARRKNPETKWGPWGLLMIYRALSKYGERALPALISLAIIVFGCMGLYLWMGITPNGAEAPLSMGQGMDWLRAFTYSLQVSTLTGGAGGLENPWAQFVLVLQRIFAPVMLALLALALRQQLKR